MKISPKYPEKVWTIIKKLTTTAWPNRWLPLLRARRLFDGGDSTARCARGSNRSQIHLWVTWTWNDAKNHHGQCPKEKQISMKIPFILIHFKNWFLLVHGLSWKCTRKRWKILEWTWWLDGLELLRFYEPDAPEVQTARPTMQPSCCDATAGYLSNSAWG